MRKNTQITSSKPKKKTREMLKRKARENRRFEMRGKNVV